MKTLKSILLLFVLVSFAQAQQPVPFRQPIIFKDSTTSSYVLMHLHQYRDTSYIRILKELTGNQKRMFWEVRDDGTYNDATYIGLRHVNRTADSTTALLGVKGGEIFGSVRLVDPTTGAVTGTLVRSFKFKKDTVTVWINDEKELEIRDGIVEVQNRLRIKGGSPGVGKTLRDADGTGLLEFMEASSVADSSERTLYQMGDTSFTKTGTPTAAYTEFLNFSYTRLANDSLLVADYYVTTRHDAGFTSVRLKISPSTTSDKSEASDVDSVFRQLRSSLPMAVGEARDITFELYNDTETDTITVENLRIYVIESFQPQESGVVNPLTDVELFEDFLGSPKSSSTDFLHKDWFLYNTGSVDATTGGTATDSTQIQNAIGVAQLVTSSGARVVLSQRTNVNVTAADGMFRLNVGTTSAKIRLKRIVNGAAQTSADSLLWGFVSVDYANAGVISQASGPSRADIPPLIGVYFRAFGGGATDSIWAYYKNGATVDSINTGVEMDAYVWKTYQINLSDTTIGFSIDGIVVATMYHALPNDLLEFIVYDKTGQTVYGFYVDYIWIRQSGISRQW